MGAFFLSFISMAEQWIIANAGNIEAGLLTSIENAVERLFTTINKANKATPDKTVITEPHI